MHPGLECMCGVLPCMLVTVESEVCLLEALEVLDVLDVWGYVGGVGGAGGGRLFAYLYAGGCAEWLKFWGFEISNSLILIKHK